MRRDPNHAQLLAWEIWWRLKHYLWLGAGIVLFLPLWVWDWFGAYRRQRVSRFFFGDRTKLPD